MIADEHNELAEQGKALASLDVRVEATARLRYADGEEAALELRQGRYWVTAAGALPGGAGAPDQQDSARPIDDDRAAGRAGSVDGAR